jgi:hypothetical protein
MYKIGVSSCGFSLTEENFRALNESGIDAIELAMSLDCHRALDCGEVAALADRYHVKLWSYHLPFAPFEIIDISSLDATI